MHVGSHVSGSALTTSRVVTPNRRLGSYTPSFFSVSAAMATVELTGLEMMFSSACTYMHTRFMVQRAPLMRQHVVQSELQGLLAAVTRTPGACLPTASVRPLTMPALICSQHSTAK